MAFLTFILGLAFRLIISVISIMMFIMFSHLLVVGARGFCDYCENTSAFHNLKVDPVPVSESNDDNYRAIVAFIGVNKIRLKTQLEKAGLRCAQLFSGFNQVLFSTNESGTSRETR